MYTENTYLYGSPGKSLAGQSIRCAHITERFTPVIVYDSEYRIDTVSGNDSGDNIAEISQTRFVLTSPRIYGHNRLNTQSERSLGMRHVHGEKARRVFEKEL